jgi:hypothetical protein
MVIDAIVSVAKALSGFQEVLRKSDADRRNLMADYFQTVGRYLHEIAISDTSPAQKFAAFEFYAQQLPDTIGEEIGNEAAKRLADQLRAIAQAKEAFARRGSESELKNNIAQVEEASGLLEGLATTIKLGRRTPRTLSSTGFTLTRARYLWAVPLIGLLGILAYHSSKVWQADYPFLAGSYLLLGDRARAQAAFADMFESMDRDTHTLATKRRRALF